MDDELKQIGMITTTLPNAFGESVYAKYGEKRLTITFVSEGKYGYKLLSRQQSIDNAAGGVISGETSNLEDIKKAIDNEHIDKNKVMVLDLEHVRLEKQISQNVTQKLEVKSVTTVTGKSGVYSVDIHTENYQTGNDVYKPFDAKLNVIFINGNMYQASSENGQPLGANKDATALIESTMKIVAQLMLKDNKIEKY